MVLYSRRGRSAFYFLEQTCSETSIPFCFEMLLCRTPKNLVVITVRKFYWARKSADVSQYMTVTCLALGPGLCWGRRWCLAGIVVHRVYLHLAFDEMGTQLTLLPTTQEDILGSSCIPWGPSLAQVQCSGLFVALEEW